MRLQFGCLGFAWLRCQWHQSEQRGVSVSGKWTVMRDGLYFTNSRTDCTEACVTNKCSDNVPVLKHYQSLSKLACVSSTDSNVSLTRHYPVCSVHVCLLIFKEGGTSFTLSPPFSCRIVATQLSAKIAPKGFWWGKEDEVCMFVCVFVYLHMYISQNVYRYRNTKYIMWLNKRTRSNVFIHIIIILIVMIIIIIIIFSRERQQNSLQCSTVTPPSNS